MNRLSPSLVREMFALALALVLALGVIAWAPSARAQEGSGTVTEVTAAEFRWGVNAESGTKGHAPQTFNFLYAGDVSSHITGPNTVIPQSAWSSKSGDVTIQKRNAEGTLSAASWADTQTDRSGAALKTGSHSGLEMVFAGGEGTINPDAGTATISWEGTSSIVYYSGFVYMTVSDPQLEVTSSSAKITAELGGHKTDRGDASLWEKIPPRRVTIADLPRDCIELGGDKGFSVSPSYLGVQYSDPTGVAPQKRDGDNWGSFPKGFVDFANDTGSGQFWYSSGGIADPMKVALPVTVGWDSGYSDDLTEVCESPTTGGNSSGSRGILGQVIDDTVEDILRSAGTDVSDTAAAWMDEAWKPLQPGAANADQGAQGAGGENAVVDSTIDSELVVDEEFAYEYEEYYSAETPMTAGTVGAVAANSSGRPSGGSTPAAANSAPASVADPGTQPVAANLPLTDVVYSNTSASSDAGNSLPQWQWWVGGVLLALAAGLFCQAVLRKD